jgi:NADH dehydrogenase FAD-containing subunit
VEVDEYFRVQKHGNIFAIGDQGCHHDLQGNPLPGNASQAIDHAKYVAEAINDFASNRRPKIHTCKTYPVIIPLGGKWAIFTGRKLYFKGLVGYLIRELVWLHYFASLVGWKGAFRIIKSNADIYSIND